VNLLKLSNAADERKISSYQKNIVVCLNRLKMTIEERKMMKKRKKEKKKKKKKKKKKLKSQKEKREESEKDSLVL